MNVKRIAINTASQSLSRVGSIAITLLSTVLLRRYLGRNEYGTYIYLTNIVMIGVSLADMGTYLTSVRESSTGFQNKTKVLGESLVLRGLLGLIAGLIVLSLLPILMPSIHPILIFSSLALLLNLIVFKESLAMMFHAFEKLYISSLIQILVSIINLVAVMFIVYFHKSIYTIFWFNSLGLALLTLPLSLYAFSHSLYKVSLDVKPIKQLFIRSLPLGGVLFLFTVYSRIDSFIMNYFLGPGAVGVYGIAYKIYDNLTLPAAFLLNAMLPEMSRIIALRTGALRQTLPKTLGILSGISLVVIIGIYLMAPFIVSILTGERGVDEIMVLRILSMATMFSYANHVTGYTVIALGQQKQSLVIAIIALIFNGLTNYYFLPLYGMYVSAVLTIATEALVLLLSGAVVMRYLNKSYEQ